MWLTYGHLRPSGHIMPDHAGDRGAVFLVLAPHDHLHINQMRALPVPCGNEYSCRWTPTIMGPVSSDHGPVQCPTSPGPATVVVDQPYAFGRGPIHRRGGSEFRAEAGAASRPGRLWHGRTGDEEPRACAGSRVRTVYNRWHSGIAGVLAAGTGGPLSGCGGPAGSWAAGPVAGRSVASNCARQRRAVQQGL